jgi:endo-1,3-1,4-beta-glycanase ExoK
MTYRRLPLSLAAALLTMAAEAGAVASDELYASAELYQNQTYTYGRFEARVRFAVGDGIISSFFLWKPGSEMPGTFWNELDFEKLGADCHLQTNPLYGSPVVDHSRREELAADLCGEYHTYAFEWTPDYIAYLVDGVEIRRDIGEAAAAFETNAPLGMQIHFNVWPGDATFGGNFDPATLPVAQAISWVQYSSFADGNFTFAWREDFTSGVLPSGWAVGNWLSPKMRSTHAAANVGFVDGFAVLSLTAEDATGFTGQPAADPEMADPDPTNPSNDAGAGGATSGGDGQSPGVATGGTGMSVTPMGDGAGSPSAAAGMPAAAGGASGSSSSPTLPADAPALSSPRSESDEGCSYGAHSPSSSPNVIGAIVLGLGSLLALRRRRAGSRPGNDAPAHPLQARR